MFKHLIALVPVALAIVFVSPAIVQQPVDAAAREQQIAIQEPMYGVPQATVILRPLNLLILDQLLRGGPASQSDRLTLAKQLAFG